MDLFWENFDAFGKFMRLKATLIIVSVKGQTFIGMQFIVVMTSIKDFKISTEIRLRWYFNIFDTFYDLCQVIINLRDPLYYGLFYTQPCRYYALVINREGKRINKQKIEAYSAWQSGASHQFEKIHFRYYILSWILKFDEFFYMLEKTHSMF